MHVLITMQFKGTNYHGFQVQKNAVTVCQTLQDAMQNLYGVRPDVKGCSRTDAGVHALEYCVSYTQPKPIQLHKLPLALNRFLPSDIRVLLMILSMQGIALLAKSTYIKFTTAMYIACLICKQVLK